MPRISDIEEKARLIRRAVLESVYAAQAGHVAGPMSSADIFAVLYFGDVLNFDAKSPWWEDRDRLVLSAGHYAPAWYAALAEAGFFPKEELRRYMKLGSRLEGHPVHFADDKEGTVPGVENTGGPLGQGVSVGVGMAMALKLKRSRARVYVLMSDAELEAGQTWEALMFAAKNRLDNLVFIIDRNNIQISSYVDRLSSIEPVAGKLESFNQHVIEVDGNSAVELVEAMRKASEVRGQPSVILANTVAGKGVTFMENDPKWHDEVPTEEELKRALEELT